MRVFLGDRHVVGRVVVVDLHVAERATTHVHVYLRMIEEHLDHFAGPMLGSDDQRCDLLEELEARVRYCPRVPPNVDVVGIGTLDFQHLSDLEDVVLGCVIEDLGHLAHGVVRASGDGLRQCGGNGLPLTQADPPEGLDNLAVLVVGRLSNHVGQVSELEVPCLLEVSDGPLDQRLLLLLLDEDPVVHDAVEGVGHHLFL
mmetsp:Transcript_39602/g.91925  ORF Transcript_39602/g.91925 Transcript_39602/m.91925 type:complete len:200 (-) Transcript_39602:1778-2377(-)